MWFTTEQVGNGEDHATFKEQIKKKDREREREDI